MDLQLKVLCVARIDRQKSQMMLVEALARHPGMALRLAGPVTQPDYMEEMLARARELGVEDRMSFAGALKPESDELLREYRSADVFILPSRHEPFGIVVLEAWAAGLPVIGSDVGGLGKLMAAHPGAAIPFEPGSALSLDGAIARFTGGGQKLRLEMSECARNAAKEYDWSKLGEKLVDFYSEI